MAETSINLNPAMRGKNLSVSLLNLTIKKFLKKHTFTLNASIKKNNNKSISLFKKCGFILKGSCKYYDYYHYY